MYVDPNKIVPERTGEYSQDLATVRATYNWNDARIGAGTIVQFATLPANAYIVGIYNYISTAFAGGTPAISFGASIAPGATGAELVAAGAITPTATGAAVLASTVAGMGLGITGNPTYQTGINGAVPITIKLSTGLTAGQGTVVIVFAKNNDK